MKIYLISKYKNQKGKVCNTNFSEFETIEDAFIQLKANIWDRDFEIGKNAYPDVEWTIIKGMKIFGIILGKILKRY